MPLSPRQTRQCLDSLGHNPRRNLGQNFLIDGNIVRKSLELAGIVAGDQVVEIGPGLGTLTAALLEAGASVYAVELDPTLAGHLRATLQVQFPESLHLLAGDAVDHPRAGLPANGQPFKVVANLPYAITSPWLDALLVAPLPARLVLMMQKEAADRITASHGSKNFGAISIFVGAAYAKAATFAVSRTCFYPVPGVDSQLLHLQCLPQPVIFSPAVRQLIRQLFTQRRKQIGALVQQHINRNPTDARFLQPWLEQLADFSAGRTHRPEDIPLAGWLELQRMAAAAL